MTGVEILVGDCRAMLRALPACSVHTCVTSPPYFGLRDYDCEGQIGLEGDIAAFVASLVEVFREVLRVLRDDGTVWLNLGDSYAGSYGNQGRKETRGEQRPINGPMQPVLDGRYPTGGSGTGSLKHTPGLKNKDRMMIPARVALALQADGWWLRDEIVWAKPNPMPSSVEDRTTPAHEMIYLLSKSPRYYFDAEAIQEPSVSKHPSGNGFARPARLSYGGRGNAEQWSDIGGTRNKRSVWTVPTRGFKGAHFATFPPALIEPCIKAGAPEGGTVLDPFGGAGTTGLVAQRLGRHAILCELNPEYAQMARERIDMDAATPLARKRMAGIKTDPAKGSKQVSMFG